MLKLTTVCAAVLVLSGCAAQDGSMGFNQLETVNYLRAQKDLPLDLVMTQRAVFKQPAVCDSDLQFAVDPDQPTYARVTKPFSPGATRLNDTIVMGMTLMSDRTIRTRVYSYFTPTDEQITEMYNALRYPGICPGEPIPEEPKKAEEE